MEDKIVCVKNGRRSPGYTPEIVEIIKKDIPEDAISLQRDFLNSTFGILRNYGNGTAFNISLTWVPKIIWINEEKFDLDRKKYKSPNIQRNLIQNLLANIIFYPNKQLEFYIGRCLLKWTTVYA